jgi:poly-gamma-glutamate capsule biosynthesis protein CapA/YwtB (metallophosphatase superfamily)
LKVAQTNSCSLANNDGLDYGYLGLEETLQTLNNVGTKATGAGKNALDAESPLIFELVGE